MKSSKSSSSLKPARKRFPEVSINKLRWQCHPETLKIKTTNDLQPTKRIIGQERAERALRLGIEMKHFGYNVFVTGLSGTGRTTTIKRLLREFEGKEVHLTDKCCVHNFRHPDAPKVITLPAGQGCRFHDDMETLINELQKFIPSVFESRRYQEQRRQVLDHFQSRQKSVLKEFEKKVKEKDFEVVQVQAGSSIRPEIVPVVEGKPIGLDQVESLVTEGKLEQRKFEVIKEHHAELQTQMEVVLRAMRNIERKAKESLEDLDIRTLLPLIKENIDEIRAKYDNRKLQTYLEEVQENIISEIDRFRKPEEQPAQPPVLGIAMAPQVEEFTEFKVNVIVDNSRTKGVPVIIETNPRFKNIFGTIDRYMTKSGVWLSDFTQIKSGSLLDADGGFLILNSLDALFEPGVWPTLKRTLKNSSLEIQPVESIYNVTTTSLKPEPIELNVKVLMIGDANTYSLLYQLDDEFKKIFKVRADFDVEMPRKEETIRQYLSYVKMICDEEHLKPFDARATAEVLEYSVRLAGRQNKLTTRFNVIADVLREANYWAEKDDTDVVTFNHVRRSIDQRIDRVKLVEEKIEEMILNGTILIDTSGVVVGQVNGISIYDTGEYAFGQPSRITAKSSLGRAGVINIEREAALSGPTHNKGVLILSGYLRGKYAQDKPLVMSASIAFEQSYSGVEGDSASSTEIYAILSSLAEVPIRQDLAVTGSVNQRGEIQPIGGVNLKVEGFFNVCKQRGLTGTQGVLIPHQNIHDLMLRHDVVEAIEKKKFHLYPLKTIDEGIEILTGIRAGKQLSNGEFERGTVNYLADRKLREYSRRWKELAED